MKNFSTLLFVFLLGIGSASVCIATSSLYSFDSPAEQQRFTTLTTELRCLVCQNQSLADSDAPLAVDLRQIIYDLIKQNKSDKVICDFLVNRYGEYILLRPPLNKYTWVLWVLPFLLLLLGVVLLVAYVRKRGVD